MSFRDKLIELIKDNTPVQMIPCEVMSVDTNKGTVEVKDMLTDTNLYDVKLQASQDDTGVLLEPTVGSMVIVAIIGNEERNCYVAGFSGLKSISLGGDAFGGLTKTKELQKQIDKNTTAIRTIINTFASGAITPSDGGLSFKTSLVTATQPLQLADLSSIENEKVKHG